MTDARIKALPVRAHEAAELVALQGEDVAVGGADGVAQALSECGGGRRLQIAIARGSHYTELDDLASRDAAPRWSVAMRIDAPAMVWATPRRKLKYSVRSRSRVS